MKIRYAEGRLSPKKWVLDCGKIDGKRRQLFFQTEAQAKIAMRGEVNDRSEVGKQWAQTETTQRAKLVSILETLKAANVTWEDVWKCYLEKQTATPEISITLREAIPSFLATKTSARRRDTYLKELKNNLNRFARGREEQKLGTITSDLMVSYVEGLKVAPITKKTTIVMIKTFFSHAFKMRWVKNNPMVGIEKPKIDRPDPKILTNPQVDHLLRTLLEKDRQILGYVVLGLFAGLRPAEAQQITWANIDLEAKLLTLDSHKSKVRQRRVVELHPSAVAWLKVCENRGPGSQVAPGSASNHIKRIRNYLGLDRWPQDVLRHTAATHLINHYGSAERTALELGNSADILFMHYRHLVRKTVSDAFFAILPNHLPAKTVHFPVSIAKTA